MSRAYDDSRYLARSLVATLLDLDANQQNAVLAYLQDELTRLGISDGIEVSGARQDRAVPHAFASNDDHRRGPNSDLQDGNAFIIGE